MKRFVTFSALLLFALSGAVCAEKTSSQLETTELKIHGETFKVEIAKTAQQWKRGLMHRETLGEREGMLFVGEEEVLQHFWMKDTPISLDMIFLSSDREVVSIHHEAEPLSTELISSQEPAQYVLEILGGEARSMGVEVGDVISFQLD